MGRVSIRKYWIGLAWIEAIMLILCYGLKPVHGTLDMKVVVVVLVVVPCLANLRECRQVFEAVHGHVTG